MYQNAIKRITHCKFLGYKTGLFVTIGKLGERTSLRLVVDQLFTHSKYL